MLLTPEQRLSIPQPLRLLSNAGQSQSLTELDYSLQEMSLIEAFLIL